MREAGDGIELDGGSSLGLDRGKRAREGSRVREVRGTWIERRELQLYGWIEGMWGKEQGRQGASGFRDGAGKSNLF
ncbi:MAG: hypothetical protein GY821_11520 [Gammaproteobacteria bacterium]|nr:hypothetical protein [Gammaproteobacteria bacterium]